MANTLHTLNSNEIPLFVKSENLREFVQVIIGKEIEYSTVDFLLSNNLLPSYKYEGNDYYISYDILDIMPIFNKEVEKIITTLIMDKNYDRTLSLLLTKISTDTKKQSDYARKSINQFSYSAFRNLLVFCGYYINKKSNSYKKAPISNSRKISDFISYQVQREILVGKSKASVFANSAYYMGCKKFLGAFLVEATSRFLPSDGIVIDLMCGSGAASNAFSTIWQTYASDSQEFCRHLALVQGTGFSKRRANEVLEILHPYIIENAKELDHYFSEFIAKEDVFFHSNTDMKIFDEYKKFISETCFYPPTESILTWQLYDEIMKRKENPILTPYILFSVYFSSIYFGVRQCIEIDSIRYAIDKLEDLHDRNWAIGALISTISYLSSGYAGQFAQPLEPKASKLTSLLDLRAKSIIHEFSIRLTALGEESEKAVYPIKILPGPWQETLLVAEKLLSNKNVVVYLDAPYKREEYSRYYHVLETLVKYDYPSVTKKGRLPDKKKGERFQSAFFTKDKNKINAELTNIIVSILNKGWICAWSYSDNGDAKILDVISQVYEKTKCKIISYSSPYQHKPQGGSKSKKVTEYCIIFRH